MDDELDDDLDLYEDDDDLDEDFDYEPESPESLLRWYHGRVL